jgi:hypothetical protein
MTVLFCFLATTDIIRWMRSAVCFAFYFDDLAAPVSGVGT